MHALQNRSEKLAKVLRFLSTVSKARTNELYIFRQCSYIACYILPQSAGFLLC